MNLSIAPMLILLRYRHLALLLTLVLLFGCGDASRRAERATPTRVASPVPTFTSTPLARPALAAATPRLATPTASAPPTATAPPTVTATPTATMPPPPSTQLAAALHAFRAGDYAAARSDLAALAANPAVGSPLQAEASFYLARAYLLDGNAQAALDAFARFESVAAADLPADHEFRVDAHFLQGDALRALGQHRQALAAYSAFLELRPDLAEMVQAEIARTHLALGDREQAITAYRAAADATQDRIAQVRLLELLAQTQLDAAQYGAAAGIYQEILLLSRNSGYRAQVQYQIGQALAVAGDEAGAIARWRGATDEDVNSRYAYLALIELVNRRVDFDLYRRGLIDLRAGAWIPAVNAFEAYLAQGGEGIDVGQALHGIGQAYLGAENFGAAIANLDRVINEHAACSCVGQAWLDKARTQVLSGDSSGARRTYRTFARTLPGDALAAEALWRSALLAMRDNNEVEAAADFLALADAFPHSERAPAALYAVALDGYLKGLHSQAVTTFERLQSAYPNYRWQAVAYWLGRSYFARSQSTEARNQWQTLVVREPDTYYGILAALALRQPQNASRRFLELVPQIADGASTLGDDDGSQAFAERWLAGWVPQSPANLSILPAAVATDPELRMGRSLLALGRRGEALEILDRVRLRYWQESHAMYSLMLAYEQMGAYRHSLLSARRLLDLSPARLVEESPIFVQTRIYPRPFALLIEQEARANQVNPLLLYSLIRQESLFEEGARSHAAAQGLAQIIPDTARWVAERLRYPNFTNELIYRPHINVKFGAYYLAWARGYLDQNEISALVGYNAGPGNAAYWREIAGPDDTLFVEILTVNEPRIYVQQVTANLYHYTRLYGR